MIYRSSNKWCYKKKTNEKERLDKNFQIRKSDTPSSKDLSNYQGELKNPFENKNKHIRIKGPTPNTNRTILAVLGVAWFSLLTSIDLEVNFFLDFLLGIFKVNLK